MDYEDNNNNQIIASEPPTALYYGSSTRLRESGIIPELSRLDKADTLWIIRFLQRHLETMRNNDTKVQESNHNSMYGLLYLRSIHEGMPSFEELRAEYLQEKYGI